MFFLKSETKNRESCLFTEMKSKTEVFLFQNKFLHLRSVFLSTGGCPKLNNSRKFLLGSLLS